MTIIFAGRRLPSEQPRTVTTTMMMMMTRKRTSRGLRSAKHRLPARLPIPLLRRQGRAKRPVRLRPRTRGSMWWQRRASLPQPRLAKGRAGGGSRQEIDPALDDEYKLCISRCILSTILCRYPLQLSILCDAVYFFVICLCTTRDCN